MKLLQIGTICFLCGNEAKHFLVKVDSPGQSGEAKRRKDDRDGKKDKNDQNISTNSGADYNTLEESVDVDEFLTSGLVEDGNNDYANSPRPRVFEGDMILNKDQINIMKTHALEKGQRSLVGSRNGIVGEKYRWPGHRLIYHFAPTLSEEQKRKVRTTLAGLQSKLSKRSNCINFVESVSNPGKGVMVKNRPSGCGSEVGYQSHLRSQTMNLHPRCFVTGVIEHEFLHALGVYHAQSRADRDNHIEIVEENIRPGKQHNFKRFDQSMINHFRLPYDYGSVMHYKKNSFSRGGRTTIRTRDPSKQNLIGQREGVSEGDINLVRKMYKCQDPTPQSKNPMEALNSFWRRLVEDSDLAELSG